jgi:hypothetical protein
MMLKCINFIAARNLPKFKNDILVINIFGLRSIGGYGGLIDCAHGKCVEHRCLACTVQAKYLNFDFRFVSPKGSDFAALRLDSVSHVFILFYFN